MDQFKRIFISVYVSAVFISSFLILYHLLTANVNLAWLGAALAVWPIALMFMRFAALNVVRTSQNLSLLTTWVVIATAISVVGARMDVTAEGNWIAASYALLIGLFGFWVYVHWYSRFNLDANKIIRVGAALPAITLYDCDGKAYRNQDFIGRPTLFMFYRGNWCPFCMAQVKELVGQYTQIVDLGVEVAFVSPQSQENSRALAKKYDVPFRFLVDEDNQVAETLQIINRNGTPLGMGLLGYERDTVLPTVIITDRNGIVIFADLTDNYRVRPDPQVFLKVLKQLGAAA